MLKGMLNYIIFMQLLVISGSALSVVEVKGFSSEQMRERYHVLVTELRCPKCQNQNLADSNSPISVDLREEIFRMLEEGKNDQEIIDFLVARYGEFVMYRPPVKKTTLMLWFMPGMLLLAGLVILLSVRRRHAGVTATVAALAVDEKARLTKLLRDDSHDQSDVSGENSTDGEGK